ncbi:MAG: FAD-dependent oxidoreductase, partial [bacterium]|nr:FAD-dependent oxidoreductase [bacterium]
VLLERNQLTSGTTWHSAAQVRALRSSKNLTDLIKYSVSLYSSLEAETGQATGWINKGSLSIATNEDRLTFIKRQEALANLYDVEATSISAGEAQERWPLMNADDVIGAVWSPGDGRVGPSDLCAALIKGAKSRGAKIFEETGVIAILTRNNKIVGLETTAGSIRCDAIALCTGLWSRKNAGLAGADIPIWPCEHFYLLTNPVEGITGNLPTLSDHDNHLYIRDDSGGLLVGCFEPMGKSIDPERIGEDFAFQLLPEDWDHFEPMLNNAMHRLPCLETAEVRMLLNGPESFTPDGSFLLGESAETQGLFLGCGMNSVGVATGGGAGMALAHCIIHGHTPTDLHEADPKRFPDCFNSVEALTARIPEILGTHYAIHYPGVQLNTARDLGKTPLHQQWLDNGAQFGQFYGWERPLYFGSKEEPVLRFGKADWFEQVAREVEQAHQHAAVFDQSTFGKIA